LPAAVAFLAITAAAAGSAGNFIRGPSSYR